jgi:opacity protein-like surface antigen
MNTWLRMAVIAVTAGALGFGIAAPVAAQGAGVGIKLGPTFADFTSDALDIENRTGWHGGLFIGGNRDGTFGWQTEFNWLRREAETVLGTKFHVDYLQVPIFLRLNIGTRSKNGFAVYGIAGPAFEIKIADKINGVTIDDSFEGTDVGLVAGAGVEITRLILEGRYEWGFRRINRDFSSATEIKSRSFTVLVGVRFN